MLEFIVYYSEPIKYIALSILVVFIILVWLMKRHIYAYIEEHRTEMQQDPVQLAIVVFYDNMTKTPEEGGGKSFNKALSDLIFTILKEAFKKMMKPVYEVGKMFIELFKSFQTVLDGIRKQIAVMRQMMTNIFRDIYNRIEVSMSTIYYLFYKLRDTIKRMYATIFIMAYMVQHTVNFAENSVSYFTKVFGGIGDYAGINIATFTMLPGIAGLTWQNATPNYCFDPRTTLFCLTPSSNSIYSVKSLYMVEIGERIYNPEDGSVHVVKAILRFIPGTTDYVDHCVYPESKPRYMYNLCGVIVSGTHAVHKNSENFVRVFEDANAHPLTEYHSPYGIISLITDTGLIPCSNGVIFRDYLDTHSEIIYDVIRQRTDCHLNNSDSSASIISSYDSVSTNELDCRDLYSGFVTLEDDWEYLAFEGDLEGVAQIGEGELTMYAFANYPGILLSGNIWILKNERWIRVCMHPDAMYVGKNESHASHVFMNGNIVTLRKKDTNITFDIRDMMESSDDQFQEDILQQLSNYGHIE